MISQTMNKDKILNISSKFHQLFFLILLLTLSLPPTLSAQFKPTPVTRSTDIITAQGKKYYLHQVKPGHTLYSISKAYNVSVKVIGQANPDLQYTAIKEGQILRIPFVELTDAFDESPKDPENFIYHVVEPQQTLLDISRKFSISVDEIIRLNPGVEEVLPAGKEIRLPRNQVSVSRKNLVPPADDQFRFHEVQPEETLFSLSRQYNIKVKSIKDANPGLRWGLTIGEIIRIPLDPEYSMPATEGIDTGSDEGNWVASDLTKSEVDSAFLMPEPSTGDCGGKVRAHHDSHFQIAYLLPLYVHTNDTLGTHDTLPGRQNDLSTEAIRFLEFLEGSLLAIDSLRQSGLTMDVHIFDTERDQNVVRRLVSSGKLDQMDLIIGPVYPENIEIVSVFSRLKGIPMVSPLSSKGTGVDNNPYLFQVNPTEQLQQDLASIYLSRFYNKNILLVIDPADQNYATTRYSNNIRNYLTYKVSRNDLLYRQVLLSEERRNLNMEDSLAFRLEDVLSLNRDNLLIMPSTDKVFVSDMINRLNNLTLHYNLTVFGRPEWGKFEALQLESLYNLNLHYYTNFSNPYVNYADSLTLDVCRKYRKNFNNEPTRFSFQGFDVTYYFIKALYLFGSDLVNSVDCWPDVLIHPTLQTSFHFVRKDSGKGFENQALSIVRYNKQSLEKEKISSTTITIQE